ncbi:hypothetical protein KDA_74840 [Dictyobacter alpinus]|uniref:Uncharacterized protein n=1 Tax=Dictyobacter alpinus TaxID=2014873 RepID=A0A402BL08_9CHLR|nr:hypothetical protein [Dictyobacter alpinus]GCE32000.1 hypothetical protein KDA_74840 [Dictyobacter alpinus]
MEQRSAVSIKATLQRQWDALELASYREAVAHDEDFMARHRECVARGETTWVDCHNQKITLLPDGTLRIGKDLYQVREEGEDRGYLRCTCAGCAFDMNYCQTNHQVRIYEYIYRKLIQQAKRPPTHLADGTIIRFETPFTFTDETKHDTFRKGTYRKSVKRKGTRVIQQSLVFYALDNEKAYHITNWKRYNYEIVSVPDGTLPTP